MNTCAKAFTMTPTLHNCAENIGTINWYNVANAQAGGGTITFSIEAMSPTFFDSFAVDGTITNNTGHDYDIKVTFVVSSAGTWHSGTGGNFGGTAVGSHGLSWLDTPFNKTYTGTVTIPAGQSVPLSYGGSIGGEGKGVGTVLIECV